MSGFNFGSNPSSGSGFSFGGNNNNQKPTSQAAPSFSFGNTETPKVGGFNFNAPAGASATPGSGFGSQSTTPAFSFNPTSVTPATNSTAPSFGLGGLGKATSTSGTNTILPATTTSSLSNSSFAPSGGLFGSGANFGSTATNTTSTLFGTSTNPNPSTATTTATPAVAPGNLFGSQQKDATNLFGTKAGSGFGFGGTSSAKSSVASTAPAAATFAPSQKSENASLAFGVTPSATASNTTTSITAGTKPVFSLSTVKTSDSTATTGITFGGVQANIATIPPTTNPTTQQAPKFTLAGADSGVKSSGFQFGEKSASTTPLSKEKPSINNANISAITTPSSTIKSVATTTSLSLSAAAGSKLETNVPKTSGEGLFGSTNNKLKPLENSSITMDNTSKVAEVKNISAATSVLRNKTIKEILNKWSADLDRYTKEFHRQAVEVSRWDRILIENGSKITSLFNEIQSIENIQREVDQNLEYINAQQQELSSILDGYETQIAPLIQRAGGHSSADEEREKAYELAETLNRQLDELSKNLTSMIEEVNHEYELGQEEENSEELSLSKVVKILNAHLSSLQWLDENANLLQHRVQHISQRSENVTKDHERVHRICFGYESGNSRRDGAMY